MLDLLWTVPLLPLVGFVCLAFAGRLLAPRAAAAVAVGSVGASALACVAAAAGFTAELPAGGRYVQTLWTWVDVAGLQPQLALRLDALSLTFALVVTVVGTLIVLYSTEFMEGEEGYARFLAYMCLFIAAMLILVLASDLLLLYLGWEGVGLCSYLLIGFWYRDAGNGRAARKAFLVTRTGDAAMALGLVLLLTRLGTLDMDQVLERAVALWQPGQTVAVVAAALLLAGAVGKSAQLPLQTWLPDAMAGPTPVSALIHAATMVTAGVYLVARLHPVFVLAPAVQHAVAVIGAATLLLAGCSALCQWDIKRVLAYSTMSQVGYMFLGLGCGAWAAAVVHFAAHAFFKALLFLGAGVLILAVHHEHSLAAMGSHLRRRHPAVLWTFLVGSAGLAAVPLVTGGFYGKEMILGVAYASPWAGGWLWLAGMTGAVLTAAYTFRLVFLAFYAPGGSPPAHAAPQPGLRLRLPLLCLAVLTVASAWFGLARAAGGAASLPDFLQHVLPAPAEPGGGLGVVLLVLGAAAPLFGLGLAFLAYCAWPAAPSRLTARPLGRAVRRLCVSGWGFDRVYDTLLVRPVQRLTRPGRRDASDLLTGGLAATGRSLHHALSLTQTGQVRLYVAGIVLGALGITALMVMR